MHTQTFKLPVVATLWDVLLSHGKNELLRACMVITDWAMTKIATAQGMSKLVITEEADEFNISLYDIKEVLFSCTQENVLEIYENTLMLGGTEDLPMKEACSRSLALIPFH